MAGLVPAMTTKGSSWEGTGFHADETGATAPNSAVLERIEGSPDVMEAIGKRIKPGKVLVTTMLRPPPTRGAARTSW